MPYSRERAIEYARRYWNRPCDDGVFWTTERSISIEQKRIELKAPAADGWEAFFAQDPASGAERAVFRRIGTTQTLLIHPWDGLADCAHFLSRCLSTGGLEINELSVKKLVMNLQTRKDTKTLCEKVDRARGQTIIDSGIMKPGDMIGYFNVDPQGDYGGARTYTHSTMYAGKVTARDPGRVTCHTVSRFPERSWVPDEWYLKDGYQYTFIHVSSDDPLLAAIAPKWSGWWKVTGIDNSQRFYNIRDNGRAFWSRQAPKSKREQLNGGEDSAYWFPHARDGIAFTWRNAGLEIWEEPRGTEYRTRGNGPLGTATRLSTTAP